jgi:hypothetical protein
VQGCHERNAAQAISFFINNNKNKNTFLDTITSKVGAEALRYSYTQRLFP